MERYWHYTVGIRLERILREGVIRLATASVTKREKPVVWFSSNPIWEPTATKLLMDEWGSTHRASKFEMQKHCGGMFRIAVSPNVARYSWSAFRRISGISEQMAKGLVIAASQQGAKPSEWRVSFRPVPRSEWLGIEQWEDGQWNLYQPNAANSLTLTA